MSPISIARPIAGAPGDEAKARQAQQRVGQAIGARRERRANIVGGEPIVRADTFHRHRRPCAAGRGIRCHAAYSDTRRHDHQRHPTARTDRPARRRCRRS